MKKKFVILPALTMVLAFAIYIVLSEKPVGKKHQEPALKDLQVDARQNLPAILKAVKDGGNANVTVKELPDLNHFFQHSETGHPREYADIPETFSPTALDAMSDWILAQME